MTGPAVTWLTDAHDPRLDVFRQLKRLRQPDEPFVVEGPVLLDYLLTSRHPVLSMVVSDDHWNKRVQADRDRLLASQAKVFILPTEEMGELVGFSFHRGILACATPAAVEPFEQWIHQLPSRATLAICPQMEDPSNLGAMIRSGHALGLDGFLLGEKAPDPLSRRVVRVSMGSALFCPAWNLGNALTDAWNWLDRAGFEFLALESSTDNTPSNRLHQQKNRPARLALIFGSEAHGLESKWRERCQRSLTIQMSPGAESLNVSASAAVAFHHFFHLPILES